MTKTHEQCRQNVCILCFGKTKEMRIVTEVQKRMIVQYFIKDYNSENILLPCGICTTCRLVVSAYSKGDFSRKVNVYDYTNLLDTPLHTRAGSNNQCECKLCNISKSIPPTFNGIPMPSRRKRGQPSSDGKYKFT